MRTLIGLVCAFALTAGAAPVTFNFTNSGGTLGGSSPFGDTRMYTNGIYTVTASSFSLPGNLSGDFTTAQLNQARIFRPSAWPAWAAPVLEAASTTIRPTVPTPAR